jgi:hypothetical protein
MPENFDYAALATARSSTEIEGYDMITAVTQSGERYYISAVGSLIDFHQSC